MRVKTERVRLEQCARCGRNHRALLFHQFRQNDGRSSVFGWWAICPNTKEPVMMSNFKDGKKALALRDRLAALEREDGLGSTMRLL